MGDKKEPPFVQIAAFGQPTYGANGINGIVNVADNIHVVDPSGKATSALIARLLPLVVVLRFPEFKPSAGAPQHGTITIVHTSPDPKIPSLPEAKLRGVLSIGVKLAYDYTNARMAFGRHDFDVLFEGAFVTRVSIKLVAEPSKEAAEAATKK